MSRRSLIIVWSMLVVCQLADMWLTVTHVRSAEARMRVLEARVSALEACE